MSKSGKEEEGISRYVPGRLIVKINRVLRYVTAALLLVAVVISTVMLFTQVPVQLNGHASDGQFIRLLGSVFNLIVGIGFIRMLTTRTPGAALSTVLYCLARAVILNEGSGLDKVLLVAAIALVFVIRKFCYVHTFEEK